MKLLSWIRHLFFPTRCACCSRVIYADQQLCEVCRDCLPVVADDVCPSCGSPKTKCVCHVERTMFPCGSPYFYEGGIKQGLLTLKRGETVHGIDFFAQQMAEYIERRYGYGFDGVVYVPMTEQKIRRRGYNQSRLLARALGKKLQLPVIDGALIRLYDTVDQHKSHLRGRKGNVLGVFEADPHLVADKHLLLVDDIVTTGATINECGKMLLLAGCEEVCGITVASTCLYHRVSIET